MNKYYNHKMNIKSCDKTGWFSGYASVFDIVDSQKEQVAPGAFQKTLAADILPKMLWQHDPTFPIGKWLKLEEHPEGLYVEGQLFLDLQKGQEAHVLMKEGVLDGLSIGYEVQQAHPEKGCNVLTTLKLLEVSLVTFPANPKARVLQTKTTVKSVVAHINKLIYQLQSN